ncbi:hypothetical protein [Kocuria sp. KH4]
MTDHATRPAGLRSALRPAPTGCGPDPDAPEGTTRTFPGTVAERTEEVVVVEEPGRPVLLRHPGRGTAAR